MSKKSCYNCIHKDIDGMETPCIECNVIDGKGDNNWVHDGIEEEDLRVSDGLILVGIISIIGVVIGKAVKLLI